MFKFRAEFILTACQSPLAAADTLEGGRVIREGQTKAK